ncbi:MAG: hypothetical protein V3W20_08165, partial [Candidatus Neomarinimicrobiota bacterium]
MIPINILTNNKHLWLLPGLSYLFNEFWPNQKVNIYGFNFPQFDLPDNFKFISLDNKNWPKEKWSNALIEMCLRTPQSHFIFMLEDFWLTSKVNHKKINHLVDYAKKQVDMLRLDLSGNRAAYSQCYNYERSNGNQIIISPPETPYQMSVQAAIWNKKMLLSILKPNENPWQVEIDGTQRLSKRPDILVLGTYRK